MDVSYNTKINGFRDDYDMFVNLYCLLKYLFMIFIIYSDLSSIFKQFEADPLCLIGKFDYNM